MQKKKKQDVVPVNPSLGIWEKQVEENLKFFENKFNIKRDVCLSSIEKIQLPDISPVENPFLQFMPNLPQTEIDAVWEAIDFPKYRENGNTPFSKVLNMNDERRPQLPGFGSYAIILDDSQESPPHIGNQAHDAMFYRSQRPEGKWQNLTEGLIYELMFFEKTGRHTALKDITLEAGSIVKTSADSFSAGVVPHVYWNDDGLSVYFYSADDSYGVLRPRRQFLYFSL